MIHYVAHSSAHYQKIVDQLIQQKIINCVENQWTEYHSSLKSAFNSTFIKTQAWRNKICDENENEKDKSKISRGRTQFFLKELIENLNSYKLPVIFADAVRTLNIENYSSCDDEPIEIWKEMENNLFDATVNESAIELTAEERTYILQNTLDEMINNKKNEAVKMRCNEPCPMCKMPCKRSSGHTSSLDENERRHDCDHQSGGLGGTHWADDVESKARELCYESCSNHVAAGNRFQKDGIYYPYSEFAQHYPWLTPQSTTEVMHEVRQYIFYNYQKELATYYNYLPCSNIPASFNHQRSILSANLKEIIEKNK
ncbi:unnamed protein product [Rotaria sp. Silwood2]|nr:unnamed protein product [Rotaria sp. Silwood2]